MQSEMHSETGSIATACSPAVRAIKDNERQSKGIEGISREIEGDRTCCAAERADRSTAAVSSDSASCCLICTSTCQVEEASDALERLHLGSISGHRCHQWSSGAICGHQAPSVVIRRHQWSSGARICGHHRGHLWSSDAISGHRGAGDLMTSDCLG